MTVELLRHTYDPELLVATAARCCYSNTPISELSNGLAENPAEVERLVNMLISINHESVLEHVSFTFAIDGISRSCSHQLVRHRIASYSQRSQRYCDCVDNFTYVTPIAVNYSGKVKEQYDNAMKMIAESYKEVWSGLINLYSEQGMKLKDAEKKANENARYILPNACTTSIVVTMNVRSLLNFFKERCCNRAQWEIRDVANAMLKQCKETAPLLFQKAGPDCAVHGKCPEGKLSCGNPVKWSDNGYFI